MQLSKLNRRKALLALLSISGTLTTGMPAISGNAIAAKSPLFKQIISDATSTPDTRAYNLLKLANLYLQNTDKATVESNYGSMGKFQLRGWEWTKKNILASWLEYLATGVSVKTTSTQNLALAMVSINLALRELRKSSDKSLKLELYFAASRLFKAMGKEADSEKCQSVLTEALNACERGGPPDLEQIRGSAVILNLLAYGLLPFDLPDTGPHTRQPPALSSLNQEKYLKAEQFRLRALALVDRLSSASHDRRKAHRDMCLWYADLGKMEKSEKQKQTLFALVGIKDDSILHPQYEVCSTQPIWWQMPKPAARGMKFCGMG